jgi:hypothetical protein
MEYYTARSGHIISNTNHLLIYLEIKLMLILLLELSNENQNFY